MNRQAVLLGSFVIGALVLAVIAVLWLSGNSLFEKQLRAVIYFEGGVAGLYVGAPVTFRGVPVGQVESIGIEIDKQSLDARIPVHIRMVPNAVRIGGRKPSAADGDSPSVSTLVQRGLRAKLVAQSFVTGQKSIDLNLMSNAPPAALVHDEETEIPVVADRFDALVDQLAEVPLTDLVHDLRGAMKELQTTLESTRKTLDLAGREVALTAGDARRTLGLAGKELVATAGETRQALGTIAGTVTTLQGHAQDSLAAVTQLADSTRDTVNAAGPELQRTLVGAREAAESARVAMNRVAELTAPGAPLRGDLDAAVRDLSQAARGLRDWSELIEEQPNALIFGRSRP